MTRLWSLARAALGKAEQEEEAMEQEQNNPSEPRTGGGGIVGAPESSPPDADFAVAMNGIWIQHRQELLQQFQKNAPLLAEPYKAAVELLAKVEFPARVHIIGHIVRDICNRLPDLVGSVKREGHVQYAQELDRIKKMWPGIDEYARGAKPGPEDRIELPWKVVVAIDALLKQRRKNKDIILDMFVSVAGANEAERQQLEPMRDEFTSIHKWFLRLTHLTNTPLTVDEHKLLQEFDKFEQIALCLLRRFFETADEIDELLQEANARSD